MAASKDLVFTQGKTFTLALRWETIPILYRPVTGIAQSAPARLTVPAHGCPDGWRAAVTGVKGMVEINGAANKLKEGDYRVVTVIDADTVEFNELDSSGFKTYVSGGHLVFNSPVDLTGATARMEIKDKVGGRTLHSLTTANGGVVIDVAGHVITLNISATDTEAFAWKAGVYDLEIVQGVVVTALLADLRKKGASPWLLDQLVKAGPSRATNRTMRKLLGDSARLNRLNLASSGIVSTANQYAALTSGSGFQVNYSGAAAFDYNALAKAMAQVQITVPITRADTGWIAQTGQAEITRRA